MHRSNNINNWKLCSSFEKQITTSAHTHTNWNVTYYLVWHRPLFLNHALLAPRSLLFSLYGLFQSPNWICDISFLPFTTISDLMCKRLFEMLEIQWLHFCGRAHIFIPPVDPTHTHTPSLARAVGCSMIDIHIVDIYLQWCIIYVVFGKR